MPRRAAEEWISSYGIGKISDSVPVKPLTGPQKAYAIELTATDARKFMQLHGNSGELFSAACVRTASPIAAKHGVKAYYTPAGHNLTNKDHLVFIREP